MPYVTCACGGRVWVAPQGIRKWQTEFDNTSIEVHCPEFRETAKNANGRPIKDFECSRMQELIGFHLHLWRR